MSAAQRLTVLVALALGVGCERSPEDAVFAEIRRARREANALTASTALAGGERVEGIWATDPAGPVLEAFRQPGILQRDTPFSVRFTVASADANRVVWVALHVQNADAHLRVPVTVDPADPLVRIDGVVSDHPDLPELAVAVQAAVLDEHGIAGPSVLVPMSMGDTASPMEVDTVRAHLGTTLAIGFTRDATAPHLVSGGQDGDVLVVDPVTGQHLHRLRGHTAAVRALATTQDSSRLASGSQDHTVRLWDLERGTLLHTLGFHQDFVQAVAFSPDDRWLVSGSRDQQVQVRRASDLSLQHELDLADSVNALSFTSDGARLAVATGRLLLTGTVQIFRTADWRLERRLELDREVTALDFTQDGRHLVAASGRGELRVWGVTTGELLHQLTGGPADTIPNVGFWPFAQSYIGTVTLSGFTTIWDLSTETMLTSGRNFLDFEVPLTSATFSFDGRTLAFGDSLGQVYLQPNSAPVGP